MLSNEDIKQLLEAGEIEIEPFHPSTIKSSGLLFHLGTTILRPLPGKIVDVKNKIVPDYDSVQITLENPYLLQPGEFVLAATYQRVTVGSRVGLLIEGRSTLARVGLTIVQTAMMVYPGHTKRAITLELANHGPNAILLYPKMKIARAALFFLSTPCTDLYDIRGKYNLQEEVGPPVFVDELLKED